MEEASIRQIEGKNEWGISIVKKGVGYVERVYNKKDITSKLEEMASDEYEG